jgi:biopolymer transport protein ExbB
MRDRPLQAILCLAVLMGAAGRAAAADVPAKVVTTVTTVGELFRKGGPMMWPILGCSIVMFAFFLERLVSLRRRAVFPSRLRQDAGTLIRAGRVDDASQQCAENGSPFGRLLHACMVRAGASGFEMEAALEEAGARVLYDLRRNTKALGVIADISPLLGLMGTVTGMIKAFNVVAKAGALGRAELLAEGISEALLTTAFGLLVAIPSMIFYNYFRSKADGLLREMEDTCLDILVDLRKKKGGA